MLDQRFFWTRYLSSRVMCGFLKVLKIPTNERTYTMLGNLKILGDLPFIIFASASLNFCK